MPLARRLDSMREEVYERADVRANKFPPATVDRILNAKLKGVYRLMCQMRKDHFLEDDVINVVPGTGNYALPTDHYRLQGLDVPYGGTNHTLRRFRWSERNMGQLDASSPLSARYRVKGTRVYFRPVPQWSAAVTIWYLPTPDELTLDAHTFEGVAGYEELAVVRAALVIKTALDEDVTALKAEEAALIADISHDAAENDDAEPNRIRDVDMEMAGESLERFFR